MLPYAYREFDIDKVLDQLMEVFWEKGNKSTSFEDISKRTNVKKQSLYNAFHDKRSLFLRALTLYKDQGIKQLQAIMSNHTSPMHMLEEIRTSTRCLAQDESHRGCLMVNSALGFGLTDPLVAYEVERMFNDVQFIYEDIIRKGQLCGRNYDPIYGTGVIPLFVEQLAWRPDDGKNRSAFGDDRGGLNTSFTFLKT